ncbi:MAG TPA: RagB/SusD family nutrient uptake outer membrane protein [Parapedobacter sp.]|nr:RagB/SusD family nutrient uptake outer membrane protein [Parapedobacter sp.]
MKTLCVIKNLLITIGLVIIAGSCKEQLLERKPDNKLVVPTTIDDFKALMEDPYTFLTNYLNYAIVSSAEYELTLENWQSLSFAPERNAYIWASDVFEQSTASGGWDNYYKQILYTNIVLEGLEKIAETQQNKEDRDQLKGVALFYRSNAFFHLALIFADVYKAESNNSLGIPLRLTSDINAPTRRATLGETYARITADLEEAIQLLPDFQRHVTRPAKAPAFALLARVYLYMGNYQQALHCADQALQRKPNLIDFNQLSWQDDYPMEMYNIETIFYANVSASASFRAPICRVKTELFNSYDDRDLRKQAFFGLNEDESHSFKGSYTGSNALFSGLSSNEMYLIKAECQARTGDLDAAMETLNTLLKTRWEEGAFEPLHSENQLDALKAIINERKKELLMRGLRWYDLKRLNTDERFQETLTHNLDGTVYELPPNDSRYTFLIPWYIIEATGIEQNKR